MFNVSFLERHEALSSRVRNYKQCHHVVVYLMSVKHSMESVTKPQFQTIIVVFEYFVLSGLFIHRKYSS